MPFQSKAQARYLFANDPAVAKEFAAHTTSFKTLPDYKTKKKFDKQAVQAATKTYER